MAKTPPYHLTSAKRQQWALPNDLDMSSPASPLADPPLPPIVASLLASRGITEAPATAAFLKPEFKSLHDPSLLPNLQAAVQRIHCALTLHQPITIFGDYDVDGISGTTILWHILKAAGATMHPIDSAASLIPTADPTAATTSSSTSIPGGVRVYIPHRVDEGYGLSCPAIEKVCSDMALPPTASDGGGGLIITVDCGITAHEPIALARSRNIDVIITDHHDFPDAPLPNANVIVHPRVPHADGSPSLYPNPDLCGAGVAYKLAWGLALDLCQAANPKETRVIGLYRDLLIEFSAFAALATVADIVPLLGENRTLVHHGMRQLLKTKLTGLRAFMDACGFETKKVNSIDIGFTLAPRLNAAGRMDHALLAVEMLTSATAQRAREIADYLETQNRQRQSTQRNMLKAALAQVTATLPPPPTTPVILPTETSTPDSPTPISESRIQNSELPLIIVAHSDEHHAGVVGIVASGLVELYHRPAFVLASNEEHCHGSARSIPGFNLHAAIEHCRPLLISGGGHAMAGGIKLKRENLAAFCQRINAFAATLIKPEHLIPTLQLDGLLTLSQTTIPLLEQLEAFEPFGRGNPHPRFLLRQVRLTAPPRAVGSTGAHLQFQFAQGKASARGIAFKAGPLHLYNDFPVGLELDLAVEPRIDRYFSTPRVDFQIVDLARSDGTPLNLNASTLTT